MICNPMRC
jgi:hypothetical protein